MKTKMEVEAISHADVRGKILTYVKITNGEKSVLINVGEKTYASVKELEDNTETKTLGEFLDGAEQKLQEEINKPQVNRGKTK